MRLFLAALLWMQYQSTVRTAIRPSQLISEVLCVQTVLIEVAPLAILAPMNMIRLRLLRLSLCYR